MAGDSELLPRIAVVGAGIFARTQYIPRLREISHLVVLKAIWSRTQVRCLPLPCPLLLLSRAVTLKLSRFCSSCVI